MPTLAPKSDVTAYTGAYPDGAAALAAAILFFILCIINIGFTIRTRAWFVLFTALSCFLEGVGYVFRRQMLYKATTNTFIVSQSLIVITPIFLTLVDYIVIGKLLQRCGDEYMNDPRLRVMRPKWVAKIFTSSDFFCLILQGSGASLLVNENKSTAHLGNVILRIGIFLQIGIFSIFAVFALLVYLSPVLVYRGNRAFLPVFVSIAVTFVLLQVRNVFRAIEFMMSTDSFVAEHEAFLYCFDFTLIYITCMIFTFVHFGFYLPRETAMTACPSRDLELGARSENPGQAMRAITAGTKSSSAMPYDTTNLSASQPVPLYNGRMYGNQHGMGNTEFNHASRQDNRIVVGPRY